MVCSREELWQEWTGSRSERREEELCRSAQSDLAHWQGQHPQRGTAKQEIELPFSVCLTPFTYWPCPSSWLLPWNPWKNYPSSSAASDHPWQTWRIIQQALASESLEVSTEEDPSPSLFLDRIDKAFCFSFDISGLMKVNFRNWMWKNKDQKLSDYTNEKTNKMDKKEEQKNTKEKKKHGQKQQKPGIPFYLLK